MVGSGFRPFPTLNELLGDTFKSRAKRVCAIVESLSCRFLIEPAKHGWLIQKRKGSRPCPFLIESPPGTIKNGKTGSIQWREPVFAFRLNLQSKST
jgi:hypothetical protein